MPQPEPYRWIAKYYDHLFEFRRPFDTAHETTILPLLEKVTSACDLCCGTGTTALNFANLGIPTYAVDLSPEMCRQARAKARKTGLPLRVIEADMRDFNLPHPVDLVTCEFDALNHVPRTSDLNRVLRSVHRALNPGGHFVFDVNTLYAFQQIWNRTWVIDKDPVVMIMRSSHKPGTRKATATVDWFIRQGKVWKRHQERVSEVCWDPQEMKDALTHAGFEKIRTWDAARFFNDALTLPGCRTFWRARKPAA